jgi:flagellar biosynthetic protein FlhB
MEGKDGRTEKPTSRRRNDARKDGNLCVSQEVSSLVVLSTGLAALWFAVPNIWAGLMDMYRSAVTFEGVKDLNPVGVAQAYATGGWRLASMLAPLFVAGVAGAIVADMVQVGPYFSTQTLRPKLNALNPLNGFKHLFSAQSLVNLGFSMVKISVVLSVVYAVVSPEIEAIIMLSTLEVDEAVAWTAALLMRVFIRVLLAYAVIAALDWCYRKYKHEKSLMMTKEEVKEDHKQHEPNPIIKRAQMKRMREFSLMGMMAAVPKASVVVTNPTHVAVALLYDPDNMNAPKVVAKGMRLVAKRIKEIALQNNIPIVERPEMARGLYKHVKVGQEIPGAFFEAVAEILVYLYRLGRDTRAKG